MNKLKEIKVLCEQAVKEFESLPKNEWNALGMDAGRAELAEEIMEILNGEVK